MQYSKTFSKNKQLNQKQQARQVPMNPMGGDLPMATRNHPNIVPSTSSFGTNIMGSGTAVNMTNVKKQETVINSIITEELKQDFKRVEEMTLLDNEDTLSMLHQDDTLSSDPKRLLSFLCDKYRCKYPELFECYRSISLWITLCLGIIIRRSETELNNICKRIQSNVIHPQTVRLPSAYSFVRENIEVGESSIENHPLFSKPFFLHRRAMFEIGTLAKCCVPSEFSVLFVDATKGTCTKYGAGGERTLYGGILGSFKRAVVVSLKIRKVKNYAFISFEFMNLVGQLLSQMSESEIRDDQFTLGQKKNMYIEDIVNKKRVLFSNRKDDDEVIYITLISSFQCIKCTNSLDIRCFSDTIYKLDENV